MGVKEAINWFRTEKKNAFASLPYCEWDALNNEALEVLLKFAEEKVGIENE